MARLPQTGSDNGIWGDILNDYLMQSHKADGTLKSNVVDAASIIDGVVQEAKLSSAVQTKLNATAGTPDWNTLTNKPTVIAAGADQAAARAAIGAGTSSLTLGTTSSTAKAGDYTPTKTDVGLGNVTNDAQVKSTDLASQAEAETGTNNTQWMTPLRTKQAITAAGASSTPGGVLLDSFAGATDDDKLDAALAYAAAQTVKPHIFFSNRQYVFTTTNRTVFSGMKLSGLGGHGDQQRAANSIPNDIRFNGSGAMFTMPASGQIFDVYIGGLSFQGNSNAIFLEGSAAVLWTSVIRDMGFNGWLHVIGSETNKLLLNAVLFDGWWNINNSYKGAIHIGGSDNNLWMGGCLLDSPVANQGAYAGAYHAWFDFLEKTVVGPMYITGDQVSGIKIDGSNGSGRGGALVLMGNGRCEGRNKDNPTYGSNIRINGGGVTLRDWSVNFGFANSASSGHTGEGGVITMTNGEVLIDGLWYDRATAVVETTPFIYQTGGDLIVRNIRRGLKGGTWTRVPRVTSTGGTISSDDSVIVNGADGVTAQQEKIGIYQNYQNETAVRMVNPSGALLVTNVTDPTRPFVTGTVQTTVVASGTSIAITKPSGIVNGDYLVAVLRSNAAASATDFTLPTPAAGSWSRLGAAFVGSDASRVHGFYGLPVSSASALTDSSFTFSGMPASSRIVGEIFIVRNVNLTTPVNSYLNSYSGTLITNGREATAYSVTADRCLQLVAPSAEIVSPNDAAPTSTSTSGWYSIGTQLQSTAGTGSTRSVVSAFCRPVSTGNSVVFDIAWISPSGQGIESITLAPAS